MGNVRKARFNIKPFTDEVDMETRQALLRLCPEKRVVLNFSCGKDSLACWLTLAEMGFEVIPVFKEMFKTEMFDRYLAYCEEFFGTKIERFPWTADLTVLIADFGGETSIERSLLLEKNDYLSDRKSFDDIILQKHGCNLSIIGTKASDSLHRRVNFQMGGPYNANQRTFCLTWRLAKNAPLDLIVKHGLSLPSWYLWNGRSPQFLFDVEFYFLKKYYPNDYARLVELVPDIGVLVCAFEKSDKPRLLKPLKKILELKKNGYPFV